MKLKFVEIAGFRGFRDATRFDLASGFNVISGRNGAGKSTILDAVDFALTGTINKFSVTNAKGGGLSEHIWWIGDGAASEHRVTVGFIDDDGRAFSVTRSREQGVDLPTSDLLQRLSKRPAASTTAIDDLMASTLIRDELISALSLDLPGQQRFSAVRAAIGAIVGDGLDIRTTKISSAAGTIFENESRRLDGAKSQLGRELNALTDARTEAARSGDLTRARALLDTSIPPEPDTPREETIRRFVAAKRATIGAMLEAVREVERQLVALAPGNEEGIATLLRDKEADLDRLRGRIEHAETVRDAQRLILETERKSDEFASRLAALVEHGHELGLQDGHCPLCAAERSEAEFAQAINATRELLAETGARIRSATEQLSEAESALSELRAKEHQLTAEIADLTGQLTNWRSALDRLAQAASKLGHELNPRDLTAANSALGEAQQSLIGIERALGVLESSRAADRVAALETRVQHLRVQQEIAETRVVDSQRALDRAKQIDNAAKSVSNDILKEQFEIVMPLLKELYRRLRPHSDWTEIDSDFGGKVRASLNFTVGDGRNPQFLFSSGQRRAAGLAFLLAVHMSRPWCLWRSLLLDDPVQHIDDYRALNLVEVLSAIRRSSRQIIVAVEDPALADLLCRRLRSSTVDPGRYFELAATPSGSASMSIQRDISPPPPRVLSQAS